MAKIHDQGLLYEADPRHAELVMKAMNLEQCRHVVTPGVKQPFSDEVMDLPIAHEPETINNLTTADVPMSKVQFSDADPEVMPVVPYSQVYGVHPNTFLFDKFGTKTLLDPTADPSTGLTKVELRARRRKYSLKSGGEKRSFIKLLSMVRHGSHPPQT